MQYNCPHCNAALSFVADHNQSSQTYETTACCNRTILVEREIIPSVRICAPCKTHLKEQGVEGDISKVPGMPKLDHSRPNSKWTFVALSGYEWHVRVCPKDIDNQALGRPAGLSFATTFTSPYEAHRFADSIDEYLDNIFVQQSVVHQNYADLNKDYRKILLRMYLASEKLDEEKYEEASRILEFSTGLEYVDYACGVYWPGGYNLYTDPNSAVGKMMNLESEGTPYRVTHLLEVSSRHKPDHYYPDQATYEQKTTE